MKKLLYVARDIIFFGITYIVASLVVGVAAGNIEGIATPDGNFTSIGLMLSFFTTMILLYLLLSYYERRHYAACLPIERNQGGFDPITILWGVILLMSTSVLILPLSDYLPTDDRSFQSDEWTLLTTVIIAPILEEYIFRGRLMSLFQHNMPPSAATMLTAAIFALSHGFSIVTINAFVAGIIFGYIYILRRSIVAPILLHMCNNAMAYAMMVLSYREQTLEEIVDSSVSNTTIYLAATAILIAGIAHISITLRRADRHARTTAIDDSISTAEVEE